MYWTRKPVWTLQLPSSPSQTTRNWMTRSGTWMISNRRSSGESDRARRGANEHLGSSLNSGPRQLLISLSAGHVSERRWLSTRPAGTRARPEEPSLSSEQSTGRLAARERRAVGRRVEQGTGRVWALSDSARKNDEPPTRSALSPPRSRARRNRGPPVRGLRVENMVSDPGSRLGRRTGESTLGEEGRFARIHSVMAASPPAGAAFEAFGACTNQTD